MSEQDDLRRLEAGDKDLAKRLADEAMIAGWFAAEADPGFVEETAAATRTQAHDPAFVARTMQRMRPRPVSQPPWAAIAAAVLVAIGLLLWTMSTPVPTLPHKSPVVIVPKPEERPVVPPPPRPEPPPPPPVIVTAPQPPPAPPAPAPVERPRPEPKPPEPKPPAPPVDPPVTIVAVAKIERLEGRVIVDGALAGADLPTGRGLDIAEKSRAVLRFPDGTTLDAGPSTKLEAITDGPEGKRLKLLSGTLTAEVAKQPAGRPLVIATPHGEALVVGTTFRLSVDKATRLEVTEGKVRLTREDKKSIEVTAGRVASTTDLVSRPIDGFTIKDIPAQGLALWLRAESGVTLNAGAVAAWADQSGNHRDAAQETPGRRPVLVPDAARGRAALRFDGADDALAATLPVEGLGGLTLAIVSSNSVDATGGAVHGENAALFWNETVDWGWVYLAPFQSNVKFRFGTTQPNNLPFHIRTTSTSALTLTVAVKDGPVETLYADGKPVERFTGKAPAIKGTQPALLIGCGARDRGFAGDIAEVLVYTRALSDAERIRLERALLNKYFSNR